MKVVFISSDFKSITVLPKDYSISKEIYNAFSKDYRLYLDTENQFPLDKEGWSDNEFLKLYGRTLVYLQIDTELTYIGNVRTLYLKAKDCLSGKWTQDKLEEELRCLFANCF